MNKYVFYISVLLNGVLLMYLFGILPFFLYLSILLNLGMLWYIKTFLQQSGELEDNTTRIMEKIDAFSQHIEGIYELEMFYGDQNLENLLEHSRQLVNDFIDFQEQHFDVEVQVETDGEETNSEE
tara:strand:+ start:361 stop:735 length:375 start_codon:yes stop_codon:yes gene_type:complete